MHDDFLKRIFDITTRKYIVNEKTAEVECNSGLSRADFNNHKAYVDGLKNELTEMQSEIKHNNTVYLEDELGDIFWDYMSLLYCLEKEGYIDKESVFERCEKKFDERIAHIESGGIWDEVKIQQKQALLDEHNKTYPN